MSHTHAQSTDVMGCFREKKIFHFSTESECVCGVLLQHLCVCAPGFVVGNRLFYLHAFATVSVCVCV